MIAIFTHLNTSNNYFWRWTESLRQFGSIDIRFSQQYLFPFSRKKYCFTSSLSYQCEHFYLPSGLFCCERATQGTPSAIMITNDIFPITLIRFFQHWIVGDLINVGTLLRPNNRVNQWNCKISIKNKWRRRTSGYN